MEASGAARRKAGFSSTEQFDEGRDMFRSLSDGEFGQRRPRKREASPSSARIKAQEAGLAAMNAAIEELDESDELEGIADPYRAARAAADARERLSGGKDAAGADGGALAEDEEEPEVGSRRQHGGNRYRNQYPMLSHGFRAPVLSVPSSQR